MLVLIDCCLFIIHLLKKFKNKSAFPCILPSSNFYPEVAPSSRRKVVISADILIKYFGLPNQNRVSAIDESVTIQDNCCRETPLPSSECCAHLSQAVLLRSI